MGASQSRFTAVISNLQVSVENQTAAKSRIMDADFASETANMSRANILQQAGTAMIAQANHGNGSNIASNYSISYERDNCETKCSDCDAYRSRGSAYVLWKRKCCCT